MNNQHRSSKNNDPAFIVVMGASAGGNSALIELAAQLTSQMNAAFFIVTHLTLEKATEYFLDHLQQRASLPCQLAKSNRTIKKNNIYLAPADRHLIIRDKTMFLVKGALENRWRPSIDVLFRSAAAAWDSHVIGIILTGMMYDGVAGMSAIQRSGGICIIQNPEEAEYPDMPNAVLNVLKPDHSANLGEMGKIIAAEIKGYRNKKDKSIPYDVVAEARLDQKGINGDAGRYRFYTGHVYTEADLYMKQTEKLEDTLWVALRLMEERKNLSLKMEADYRTKGFLGMADQNRERANNIDIHIQRLRKVLFTG